MYSKMPTKRKDKHLFLALDDQVELFIEKSFTLSKSLNLIGYQGENFDSSKQHQSLKYLYLVAQRDEVY